jgi:trehalose synthase
VKKPGSASNPLWYKDAILYELHVRAFADSNADGIGDFTGLLGKLDYLQELGVTCLWLLPFFPSPLRDDGYDIADYKDVHPSYGTLDDFQRFLDAAHLRGMQVVIELVMNHSSDQHPWFQRARHAPAGSPERDFYVWSDRNDRFPGVPIIFNDTETSNWAWDAVAGAYYWHRFFSHQPDLNYDNPAVMEEMLNAMRFWLDRGVDGLRLDAIPYLVERDGTRCENLPETHALIRIVRRVIDAEYSNRFLLAEANQWPSDVRPYFGENDECNMAFHFPLMPRIYVAVRQEDRQPIVDIMEQTPAIPDACQWGLFLRNHDELTLEMVTRDERDYMYLAYSSDPRTRINLGIRRRLAPLLDNNRERIELLNSLLLSFPGTPILYYGDEIGMGDNVDLGDRNGVRTPMQWNASPNGGFSTADPARLYSPAISDPVYGYQAVNVEEQRENPSSLLQWTRNMIGLRKLFSLFGRGSLRFLNPPNRKVIAYIRQLGDESVLCVANLSRFAQPVALDLTEYEGRVPMEVFGYNAFPSITAQPYVLSLAPYSFLWFELQGSIAAATPEQEPHAETEGVLAGAVQTVLPGEQAQPFSSPESFPSHRTDSEAPVEVHDVAARKGLLLHATPGTSQELRDLIAALSQSSAEFAPELDITLAFPNPRRDGEANGHAMDLGLSPTTRRLQLAPYSPLAKLPQSWPYAGNSYVDLANLAERLSVAAVVQLGPEKDVLPWPCILALANPVLKKEVGLSIASYQLGRYRGLLNSATLRPITRALYSADISYPLAPDVVYSPEFLRYLASLVPAGDTASSGELILWPALEAIAQSIGIAQVDVGEREFAQPPNPDVTALLTQILSSMFAEIERRASYWQRSRPIYPVHNTAACGPPREDAARPGERLADLPESSSTRSVDVSSMLESFHLAAGNLHEIWSQVMAPGTLLGIKRLAEIPAADFRMADALWVRIVWDFLVAYRSRSVNRTHIFGALVPLYLGWAASNVLRTAAMSDFETEEHTAALALAFDADKPYLMARWRWPDRFTP